jgi:hypothetical protein
MKRKQVPFLISEEEELDIKEIEQHFKRDGRNDTLRYCVSVVKDIVKKEKEGK